jgi:MFS family permease
MTSVNVIAETAPLQKPKVVATKSSVAAAVAGNVLEFYDFTTYSFFAVMIGQHYFPNKDPFISLMLSVASFGVGFITRPLGGILIGAYADRAGRKPAMMLTVALMAVGMLVIALTPSYSTIGVAAPILVVLARLVQGFALGGEVGPATSFLVEAAPPDKRGFYASWQLASQGLSTMIAGAIGLGLSLTLPKEDMADWGWRIPFAAGVLIIPVALIMRRQMPETLDTHAPSTHHSMGGVLGSLLTEHLRPFLVAFVLVASGTVGTYVLTYMTTYAMTTLKMSPSVSIAATQIFGLCTFVFSLLGGWLSDHIGRKPLIIWPKVFWLFACYPAFLLIVAYKDATTLLGVTAILTAVGSLGSVLLVVIPESMPKAVRSSGLSVAYSLAVTIFGGTAQPIFAWLIHTTGDPVSPAWYLLVATLAGLIAVLMLPETKDKKLD